MPKCAKMMVRSCVVFLFLWICSATASVSFAATYYLAPTGDDRALGTSPQRPWKTLYRVSTVSLAAGDSILLQRAGVWHESITLGADGDVDRPIVLAAYGKGDRPCIDGGDPIEPSKFETTDAVGVYRAPFDRQLKLVWQGTGAPLNQMQSKEEVADHEGSCWCDQTWIYLHPNGNVDPRTSKLSYEMPGREVDIEISHSHIAIRSISIRHAARADRGALTVWANHDLAGIELSDCDISYNSGRGIWFDGPAENAIHEVSILANEFRSNDGSGALLILASGGKVVGNKFVQNCQREIEPWQAAIRLWSGGISNLEIGNNTIADQKWGHDHDSSMGIHCDETGAGVSVIGNIVSNVDHAGIEVENTRAVTIEKNTVNGCNIGILLNRAGHNHIVRGNTVHDSRSQGIAVQGWSAHGVDAQPEILVEGRFFTRNLIVDNLCTGSQWGNLKAVGGGEQIDHPLGNTYRNNDLGPERSGFIEWGDRKLDRYDQWRAINAE